MCMKRRLLFPTSTTSLTPSPVPPLCASPQFDATSRSSKDSKIVANYFIKIQKIKDDAVSKDVAKMMDKVLTLRENNWGEASA
jgi:hypothetical protein